MLKTVLGAMVVILLMQCAGLPPRPKKDQPPAVKAVQTLAFGSCNRVELPQEFWPVIAAQNPDVWLWLGDIIYADTEDMLVMHNMYQRLKTNAHYQQFRKQVPVLGVWDDHDYGVNDGDKRYPYRKESKQELLNFLDVDTAAAVFRREGVYQDFQVPLTGSSQQLKIILLDVRYFRDTLQRDTLGPQRYHPNSQGDILGAAQWQWLEQLLDTSTATLNIIAGGIQFTQKDQYFEKWANFPLALERLHRLLSDHPDQPVLLLSGDRHIGEIAKIEIPGLNYPLYEITSSGLTHAYVQVQEKNMNRIGPVIGDKNFGVLKFRPLETQLIIEASLMEPEEGSVHFTHTWAYPLKK